MPPRPAGGLAPRPAVSPAVPQGGGRPTPARPAVSPLTRSTPARMPAAAPRSITPVVAQPAVLAATEPEIAASSSAVAETGSPMIAGPDVRDPGTTRAADGAADSTVAPRAGGWLSPEGALTGEFGELVEDIPAKPTAQAPVFPTPPAPWSAIRTPIAASAPVSDESFFGGADIDAGLAAPRQPMGGTAAVPDASASGGDAAFGTWTPEASEVATPHEVSDVPGLLDRSAAEGEEWADAYGTEAEAIHGLEASSPQGAEPQATTEARDPVGEAAGGRSDRVSNWWEAETSAAGADAARGDAGDYLASEWPEQGQAPDPSTLPTPVLGVAALDSSWTGQVPESLTFPPAIADATAGTVADEYSWASAGSGVSDGGADAAIEHAPGQDSWEFAPSADGGGSLHAQPTSSSLAAAEVLELIAGQLRNGTLRADGYSPALGEAAALSAVLAALLGVDARWDVPR